MALSHAFRKPQTVSPVASAPAARVGPCWRYGAALLLAALLGTLALGDRVPWLVDSAYSDYILAHAPQVAFVRRAVAVWRTLPLWSPVYNAGYPLYANPLASPAYPPGWLAYLLPLPWGLNLALLLHLAWAVLGWGCWARRNGVPDWPGVGLVAGLLPKTLALLLGGHVTLMYAVAWVPWLLLALGQPHSVGPSAAIEKGREAAGGGLLAPGLVLGLLLLADPRAGALALPVLAVGTWAGRRGWRTWLTGLLRTAALAALIAAPLLLPLAVFLRHTPRHTLTLADRLAYSASPVWLLDMVLVYPGPMLEYRFYLPWAVGLLAVRAWWAGGARRAGVLAGLGALLALGRYGPLAWLWALPGLGWTRVPARFGWVLAWGVLWAAVQAPRHAPAVSRRPGYRRLWLVWGLVGLAVRAGLPWVTARPLSWGYLVAWLADAGAWWALRPGNAPRLGRLWALALVAGLAVLAPIATLRPLSQVEAPDQAVAEAVLASTHMAAQPWAQRWAGPRVYSPSFSVGPWTAARLGLPLAYGVDPLYLATWSGWLDGASGIPRQGYSVTVPFLAQDPQVDNAAYRADARALAEARVAALVAAFPHEAPGWRFQNRVAGLWVYRNPAACPLAWVEDPDAPDCHARPAHLLLWQPNRVVVEAQGPGRLVLSEAAYLWWQARVDGQPVPPDPARAPWRAVRLPAGTHRVEWVLRPWDVWAGWSLVLLTGGAMAYDAYRQRRRLV